jgi:hypothetical protein
VGGNLCIEPQRRREKRWKIYKLIFHSAFLGMFLKTFTSLFCASELFKAFCSNLWGFKAFLVLFYFEAFLCENDLKVVRSINSFVVLRIKNSLPIN